MSFLATFERKKERKKATSVTVSLFQNLKESQRKAFPGTVDVTSSRRERIVVGVILEK
jgi:hypothetical protein